MIGGQTDAQLRLAAQKRAVHLVDAVAIRKALLGYPVALTELEAGAVISICDTYGMSRDLVAQGLGMDPRQVSREIERRQRDLPVARADFLAVAARQPALELIGAVQAWDRDAVAKVLSGLDLEEWCALAVVLAAFAGGVRDPREPGVDETGVPR